MLPIIRYHIKSTQLKPFIKFIWYLETDLNVSIRNILLPTDNIDIIINLSDKIKYQIENQNYGTSNIHFLGHHNKQSLIIQEGKLKVFGIAFQTFGLYPFLNIPILEFNHCVIDINVLSKQLVHLLESCIYSNSNTQHTALAIEQALESILPLSSEKIKTMQLLNHFKSKILNMSISQFCTDNTINIKYLERACLKFTGYTPKLLQRIVRFQSVSSHLAFGEATNTFADLAFHNDYYDQSHFIREFKIFSGVAPKEFLNKNATINQNAKYMYL